ncbi:hypothetical protein [Marinomonas sp. 2405UD68-3]|uniref:hypothetical protein n=1 Tax=Marinomonas sp. 2405UD68-3 TaxID=3391835 RepID=UPI0039C9A177
MRFLRIYIFPSALAFLFLIYAIYDLKIFSPPQRPSLAITINEKNAEDFGLNYISMNNIHFMGGNLNIKKSTKVSGGACFAELEEKDSIYELDINVPNTPTQNNFDGEIIITGDVLLEVQKEAIRTIKNKINLSYKLILSCYKKINDKRTLLDN